VHYLQQAGSCSPEEATAQLDEAVKVLKYEIASTGQVLLENLGHLVGYGTGYVFKPLDLSGFSLGPVASTTEPIVPETEATEALVSDEPVVEDESLPTTAESVEAVVPEETVQSTEEEVQETQDVAAAGVVEEELIAEQPTSGNRSFIYGLVAAIALLALAGLYYYYQYYTDIPRYTAQNTVQPIAEEFIVPVDTASVLEDTLATPIDTAEQLVEGEETPVVDALRVEHKYAIVIGTHRTLAQAYEEAEAFNKDGHESVRVLTPNLAKNLKKVIWDTYPTKEERDSALQYVRKHVKTDAWPTVLNRNNE